MLDHEWLGFVDIVTRVETQLPLVRLALEKRILVICQKPIAPGWNAAVEIVTAAESRECL